MEDDEDRREVELLAVSPKTSSVINNETTYEDDEFETDEDDDFDMSEVRRTMEQQLLVDCKNEFSQFRCFFGLIQLII